MESGEIGSGEAANPAASIFLAIAGFAARATWVGGLILLCMVVLLWYFQEKLLFYPGVPQGFETPDKNPKGLRSPAERGLPFEELWLRTVDGVKLHCWLIKQKLPQVAAHAPTLIFFHGNAGNVGFRLPNVELLYKHVGVNVLIVSYRGYGFSEGSPTEAGVYRDGEAALDMLVERQNELHIDANKIFLFGRSLGGAVAIDLAVQRPHQVRGVIVENTFTSLLDMVWVVFPLLRPFQRTVRILQRLYMDNGEKIQRLRLPILFISGQKDELVPTRHMKKLFELCPSPLKEKEDVPLGGHNDTWEWAIGGKSYYDRIAAFIQHALQFEDQQSRQQIDESGLTRRRPSSSPSDTLTIPSISKSGAQVLEEEERSVHDLPLSVTPADAAAMCSSGASESVLPKDTVEEGEDQAPKYVESCSPTSLDLPTAARAAREVVAAAASAASSAAAKAASVAFSADAGASHRSRVGAEQGDEGRSEPSTASGLRQRVVDATCERRSE
ncbi:phospholipase/carboxylesterase [Toxoplasma gondii p89]|uniref:Phospholipase/carboxylesterase n=2 Tax=Toxoplasma gondii TaxID=5811 RepID=A0A2G8XST4_TOXGO|nr:phospholipase/carboxylesterase [Toxoplasma gondii p89]PIL98093.1 phospholipase/carboxylesterase [Toxoplasma gondii COUG]